MHGALHEWAVEGFTHLPGAAYTHGAKGGAVIGAAAADNLKALRRTGKMMILPRNLDGGFHRLRSTTAKKHGWTSIDDMLDEYQSGERRVNYLPQTYWLCEQDAKFDHIFKFEDLLKGPKQVQKMIDEK